MKRIVGIICVISAFLVVLCGCSTDRSAPVVSFYSVYRDTAQSNDERLAHLEHHFSELEVKVSEIKSDCLNSYNRYQDSTIGFLMLFGVLITVVVAVVGVVAPLLFNKQIEREFNPKIKEIEGKLSGIKTVKDEIVEIKTQIVAAKNEAIETAEEIARATRWFTIAYTSTDLNLKIKLYSRPLKSELRRYIVPKQCIADFVYKVQKKPHGSFEVVCRCCQHNIDGISEHPFVKVAP